MYIHKFLLVYLKLILNVKKIMNTIILRTTRVYFVVGRYVLYIVFVIDDYSWITAILLFIYLFKI